MNIIFRRTDLPSLSNVSSGRICSSCHPKVCIDRFDLQTFTMSGYSQYISISTLLPEQTQELLFLMRRYLQFLVVLHSNKTPLALGISYHKCRIHQVRTVDPQEPVWL